MSTVLERQLKESGKLIKKGVLLNENSRGEFIRAQYRQEILKKQSEKILKDLRKHRI